METLHTEGQSPFIAEEATGDSEEQQLYAECPVDGCCEAILVVELDDHLELHTEQDSHMMPDEKNVVEPSSSLSNIGNTDTPLEIRSIESRPSRGGRALSRERQRSTIQQWRQLLAKPSRNGSSRHETQARLTASHQGRKKLGVCHTHTTSPPGISHGC
jgi:zinc finger-containing ubiquitin peptidase 1